MSTEDELEEIRNTVKWRAKLLHRLHVEMVEIVKEQMDHQRAMSKEELKEVKVKLHELQTLQLSLLRAEEALHDRLCSKSDQSKSDYDAIRRKIGRALDRIRGEDPTEGIFRSASRSSD